MNTKIMMLTAIFALSAVAITPLVSADGPGQCYLGTYACVCLDTYQGKCPSEYPGNDTNCTASVRLVNSGLGSEWIGTGCDVAILDYLES
jgi:hypothetical protein